MNRPLTEVFSNRSYNTLLEPRLCSHKLKPCVACPHCLSQSRQVVQENSSYPICQQETSHRYILGLYEIQRRILDAFPYILLENCASGGGRFDPGMLSLSSVIWCSDNTDALTRMKIQYGTSILYPASCIGAHVTAVPNHITDNTTRIRTRGLLAMCGSYG